MDRYNPINTQLFIQNRKLLSKKLEKNCFAVFNSNDIMPTNADGTMPFKQNSDLFWLSGIDQEESVLILFPDHRDKNLQEILFVKETSSLIAVWEGEKLNKEQAKNVSGIKTVLWLSDLDKTINSFTSLCSGVYLNKNIHSRAASKVETRDDRFRKDLISKYPTINTLEIAPYMHELRSIKSKHEISLMQKACDITEKGFRRILPFIKPGIMEYEIEAEIMHEFLINKSKGFAYEPIIGSGKDSCVLHYIENNKMCKDGDILLMDFGAEYANYKSDLTRTVPVNGKFTKRQKQVYISVLKVMKEAINMLRPGIFIQEYQKEVVNLMQEELIGLGLFSKHDVKKQDKKNPLYKKYFMHGTSHFLGLDVHDVGDFNKAIEVGMVFTCEPGIYIREEKLGIRLEDDILISDNGALNLMGNIPIEVEEIENLMNSS
jgi:Xaa-Pro aminopeptidase